MYCPLEAVVSKWYGESEQNLAKVCAGCLGDWGGGAVIVMMVVCALGGGATMVGALRRLKGGW